MQNDIITLEESPFYVVMDDEKNVISSFVCGNLSKKKEVVYQVFTRLFGNTNTTNKSWGTLKENGVGKFNDFTAKA